jgi:hypothetical protein
MKLTASLFGSFLLFSFLCSSCAISRQEDKVALLCNVELSGDRFTFPLVKVLKDPSGVGDKLRTGEDIGRFGLRLPSNRDVSYPRQVIAVFVVSQEEEAFEKRLELVETLAVNDGRIVETGGAPETFEIH